jgi:hypothetical protein
MNENKKRTTMHIANGGQVAKLLVFAFLHLLCQVKVM